MTVVRASCPVCGPIEGDGSDFHLVTFTRESGRNFYEFVCPHCDRLVQKAADDECVEMMRRGNISETIIDVPAEALELHDGDALSEDDLIDLLKTLHTTDELTRLL